MKRQESPLKGSGLPEDFPGVEEAENSSIKIVELVYGGDVEIWQCLVVALILVMLRDNGIVQ